MFILDKLYPIAGKIRNNRSILNGGLFAIYSFFSKGIAFLLVLILASFLTPDDFGRLSMFNTMVALFLIVVSFATNGYGSISYFNDTKEDFKNSISIILLYGVISLFVIALPIVFIIYVPVIDIPFSSYYCWYALLIAFCLFVFGIHQDYYRVQEKIRAYGVFNCGSAVANMILSIFLVVIVFHTWEGRMYAYLGCSVALCIISLILLNKDKLLVVPTNKKKWKEILFWGIPMIPHAASGWLKQGADQYIINSNYTVYEVGIFGFAMTLTNIIATIGSAFNSSHSVSVFKILSSDATDKILALKKQTRLMLIVYIAASIVTVIASTVLVLLFYDKYRVSLPYFWILSISGLLQCVYFLYCNYLFYYSNTKQLMYITFTTSIIHLLLSLIFTRYSLFLTACIYVLSQMIMNAFVYKKSIGLIKKNIENGKIY